MSDALVGLFFNAPLSRDLPVSDGLWKGRIRERTASGDYLVELFSWWDGQPTKCLLIARDQMLGDEWTFYPSMVAMHVSLGCQEFFSDDITTPGCEPGVCGRPVTRIVVIAGLETIVRCKRCAPFYVGQEREITASDLEAPRPNLRDARLAIVEELAHDLLTTRTETR